MKYLLLVHWHVIILAAICFAIWAFMLQKSKLIWPIGPAVFCLTQGIGALLFLTYILRNETDGLIALRFIFLITALLGSIGIYLLAREFEVKYPTVDVGWACAAAIVGGIGLYFFTHELARIDTLGEVGDKIRGLTIASTVAIETLVMISYHFWDVRKTEQIATHHMFATLGIMCCIFILFQKKDPLLKLTPPVLIEKIDSLIK